MSAKRKDLWPYDDILQKGVPLFFKDPDNNSNPEDEPLGPEDAALLKKIIENAREASAIPKTTGTVSNAVNHQIKPPLAFERIESSPILKEIAALLISKVTLSPEEFLQYYEKTEKSLLEGSQALSSLKISEETCLSIEAVLASCLEESSYAFFILKTYFSDFLKATCEEEGLTIEAFSKKYVQPSQNHLSKKRYETGKAQIKRYPPSYAA